MRFEPILEAPHTILLADAMYVAVSAAALGRAGKASKRLPALRNRAERLAQRIDDVRESDLSASDRYDRVETLSRQAEGAEFLLAAAYSPYISELATVHIAATAALESHANSMVASRLSGQARKEFEFLGLEAKWELLPTLFGKPSFKREREPLQSIIRVSRYRNRLVHYKKRKELFNPPGTPLFLKRLGLELAEAERSHASTRKAIEVLAKHIDKPRPAWLDHPTSHFFDIEWVRPT